MDVYDHLILIDSENPEVWNSRGNLLSDMGKLEEAIKSFDRALEVCFDDSELDAGSINRMGNAYIDLGKLDEITALKSEFNFRLLVDDAHGFGTMGPTGAGTGEHFGVQDKVDLYFGTFAKAMAGFGAFVATDEDVCMSLRYTMRSQMFAKSLTMPMVEGAIKRLEMLKSQPERREKLWTIAHALQNGLKADGMNIGITNSMVTPVYLSGSVAEGMQVVFDLRENYNIFCSIVVYPVIPKGQLLLRLIPTSMHTLEDVKYTIKAFKNVAEKLAKGEYNKELLIDASKL